MSTHTLNERCSAGYEKMKKLLFGLDDFRSDLSHGGHFKIRNNYFHSVPAVLVGKRIRLRGVSTRQCTHRLEAALVANPILFLRHHLIVDPMSQEQEPKVWTTMRAPPNNLEKTPTRTEGPVRKV